jgi:ribose transport system ATP-binding protein
MIGSPLKDFYPVHKSDFGDEILVFNEITTDIIKNPISLKLHKGEILGVFGLMGSGIIEIGEILFGIKPIGSGYIKFKGNLIGQKGIQKHILQKIAYVSAERKKNGMIGSMSVLENMALPDLVLNKKIFLDYECDKKRALHWKKKFSIKTSDITNTMATLSGGNQQKVILSKWLDGKPELLILNEPTRGIDIGSKAEIYKFVEEFCRNGGAVVLISSELSEIFALSDKYLVLHGGIIQNKVFSFGEIDEKNIMAMAMGLKL